MAGEFIRIVEVSIAAALVLSVPMIALAQNASPPPAGAATSSREGNIYIYGHRKHQPREGRPLTGRASQVDDEVQELLIQTDDLDKTFAKGSQ